MEWFEALKQAVIYAMQMYDRNPLFVHPNFKTIAVLIVVCLAFDLGCGLYEEMKEKRARKKRKKGY